MVTHCAINRPKKNQVGFRISQVKLDTPTTQTPRHTIHSFRGDGGSGVSDSARTLSKEQKSVKPITPASTRTDRQLSCPGRAGRRASCLAPLLSPPTRLP